MSNGQEARRELLEPRVRVLHDEAALAARVDELARTIAARVPGDVTLVGVLKGAFVFLADLIRALDRHGLTPRVDFMRLSSYGMAKTSSGRIHLIGAAPDVAGRAVVLVDDIEDTGRSLAFARDLLLEQGASAIWTCVLADKPTRREVDFAADFIGFEVPDVFLVGYGIDYAERYRHLPYLGTIE